MDERFKKINKLLTDYSLGKFHKKLSISPRMDEVDAFISGVNMLGEELKETTISRNYFNNIFNSVSDMVFVVGKTGLVQNINNAVFNQLGYNLDALMGQSIDFLAAAQEDKLFPAIIKLVKQGQHTQREILFKGHEQQTMPVLITIAHLLNEEKKKVGFLITAKDITLQRQTEKIIIRTITDTQENERQRFAKDIHDSLGQQISAIKFYIGTSVNIIKDVRQREILLKSNDALVKVLADMRNICFNLMPKTLESFGLVEAVKELCSQNTALNKIKFDIVGEENFPHIDKSAEIALFRIVQEFISNALRHGHASRIELFFGYNDKYVTVMLKDNGKGFDMKGNFSRGMGLQNVQSRVRAHNGTAKISSTPGKGTKYELTLPIND